MSEIRIYVEGGGDGSESRAAVRQAVGMFLRDLRARAEQRRIGWKIIACGSRSQAYKNFCTALETHPDSFNILLVDAEAAVEHKPWQHLKQRDSWSQPPGTTDDQCQLMVQTMESWLVIDEQALQTFYRQGFHVKQLPKHNTIEAVSKEDIAAALSRATKDTQAGVYHKVRHGSKLLGMLDVARVRAAAPHCDRLFRTIEQLINRDP